MSTAELTAFNIFRKELNLSDENATKLIEAIEGLQQKKTDYALTEYKSHFKEDFQRIDLKFIELELKLEQNKNELLKWFIGMFFALSLMIIGLYFKN